MGANFILISLCFFSLAFTKAVGSKRGPRLPRMGWESMERRGWGHRIRSPQLQSIPHPPTSRAGQRPVGEGEGRAGRPRPRPPRPLSREEDRVAPRPRDVERSRDDEARSSRARGGATGGVRLLGAQDPLSVSCQPAPMSTISSLFSDHTISEPSGPTQHQLDIHALAHDPHRYLVPGSAPLGLPENPPKRTCHFPTSEQTPFTGPFFLRSPPAP